MSEWLHGPILDQHYTICQLWAILNRLPIDRVDHPLNQAETAGPHVDGAEFVDIEPRKRLCFVGAHGSHGHVRRHRCRKAGAHGVLAWIAVERVDGRGPIVREAEPRWEPLADNGIPQHIEVNGRCHVGLRAEGERVVGVTD
ncbi:hypothetical protein LH935_05875 [Gordonia polyisoprenivorans]|uniref:hypothetical protein n=1 Tax=Gordonia polyisoprenivorans TaxID=84595 RepID=UPI0022340866|nr:hypothetical protein LH935_05875 [Gordonia polyisoprenivorans]